MSEIDKVIKWIPINESLPNKFIPVLVTVDNKGQRSTCIRTITWQDSKHACWSRDTYNVIAWQPLPKPYKEE